MDDGTDPGGGSRDGHFVANIAMRETVARVAFNGGEILQIVRVSQLVPVGVAAIRLRPRHHHTCTGRPEKPGPPRYEKFLRALSFRICRGDTETESRPSRTNPAAP